MENGDVSAPEFVDIHVLERERLAREGRVKTGILTAAYDASAAESSFASGESALELRIVRRTQGILRGRCRQF
jgi:hypothetical protein